MTSSSAVDSPAGPVGAGRPSASTATDLLSLATSAEQDALERLALALGGRSSCRVAGPDTKYLEGRAAALALVRRALGRATGPGPAAPGEQDGPAVEGAARRWQVVADAGRGPAWEAYRTGGREALDELAAHLRVTR